MRIGPLILLSSLVLVPASASAQVPPVDADLVLSGGMIHDGTGQKGYVGDVAIRAGTIVAVGNFPRGKTPQIIDCAGLVICPGFIDLHNHSDEPICAPATRANVNYLTQGCTTIVTGNCGAGPVNVNAYYDRIDAPGAGTHVAHLIPHGSLREEVMGSVKRAPTTEELERMRALARQGMEEGAWGMSTGLIYVPGTYSDTNELAAVAEVVGDCGGLYASHIRNEGLELIESIEEALEIGRRGSCPVHISHFKASGKSAWGSVRIAARIIEEARGQGQTVTADQYPYSASSTSLEATLLPSWALEGGDKQLLARLDDPENCGRIREHVADRLTVHDKLQIASYDPRPDWVGKLLSEIAASEGRDAVDLVIEIERAGGARIVNFGMSDEDVQFVMQLEWVATASDGSAKIPTADRPHPRSFGTFSRKIGEFSLARKVVPLEQAIRSATGLPAEILKWTDRGTLAPQAAADVVVIDPRSFRDTATYEAPFSYSLGVRYVFVAGEPAVFDGVPTGALAGRALRKPPSHP
jgi:N-acyl-D-aspartate/D-glutamate deacylase